MNSGIPTCIENLTDSGITHIRSETMLEAVHAQLSEAKTQAEQFWIHGNEIGKSYVFEDLPLRSGNGQASERTAAKEARIDVVLQVYEYYFKAAQRNDAR